MASANEVAQLKSAIDANDLERVVALMARDDALHQAPLGYGEDGPLTWVAECRVPWEAPSPTRLAIAAWMIENGSDVHQGGDGPLMRAALNGYRIPMMELLVVHGADVNALWHGHFPIVFAPCESLDPDSLRWLLDRGADPNRRDPRQSVMGEPFHGTALDYAIGSYARSPERLRACIDILLEAGGETKYDAPVVSLLRGRLSELAAFIDADPSLVDATFLGLDFGMTGGRRLALRGATLLHVAAEYGLIDAVTLLLDRGANIDARATIDADGLGGQTAIFHAVTQFDDFGLPVARLLIDRGANLALQVQIPGDYEQPGQVVVCTPLGYARSFGGPSDRATVALLRESGAAE